MNLKIERYSSQRNHRLSGGCGCGLIMVSLGIALIVGIALIAPALPAIGLRLAGFQPIEQPVHESTPEPIPVIIAPQTSSQMILSAGTFGQRTLPQSSAYTMQTGINEAGADVAQITIAESGISTVCAQYTQVCSESGNPFRNVTVNLQNNRATISGEAFISSLNTWQAVSVIVSLSETNTIQVEGVEVGGTLFAIPDGELGQRIRDVQSTANEAIRQLGVQTNGSSYSLSDIILTETQLVATFR